MAYLSNGKPYINECKQITVTNYNIDESQKQNVEFKKTQKSTFCLIPFV